MRRLSLLMLLFASPLWAQSVKMPAEVKVPVGRLASVVIDWEGTDLRWTNPGDDLDVFREYDQDAKKVRLRVIGYRPGIYKLQAIACKADKLSDFASCNLIIGDPLPPIPPVPPDPPIPPGPVPVPGKATRAMIVYETSEATKYPAKQQQILYSTAVRDYLRSHT